MLYRYEVKYELVDRDGEDRTVTTHVVAPGMDEAMRTGREWLDGSYDPLDVIEATFVRGEQVE